MGDIARGYACLGIDLGPNSVGWALIGSNGNNSGEIVSTGVRAFEAGLDELEKDGRGKSRNVNRREARQIRRGLDRRARRITKLAGILMRAGMFPECEYSNKSERHAILEKLDKEVGSPYQLRARALDEKLSAHELGRALYHLGQRRGFRKTERGFRKAEAKKDEDLGKVKSGISELDKLIEGAGARTLGEYFSTIDSVQRIRCKYTSRKMYGHEFEMIWKAQRDFRPDVLTDELKAEVHRAIFYQRPLKSQKHLIGQCELEIGRKRAPWAVLQAQRFRYLQQLNNLRVEEAPDRETPELTDEERQKLIPLFENQREITFGKMRGILKLRGTKFNLELRGEKKLKGNSTTAKLTAVFGQERWDAMSEVERDHVIDDVRSIVKEETLRKRGCDTWKLDEESARKLSRITLEEGHCNFSRQALKRILPRLEQGQPLMTAIRELYPDRWSRAGKAHDALPPVRSEYLPELRNPIVERTLTELRKVVNAIIGEHGKPDMIRVELGRDLKQSAKNRAETTKRMRNNEKRRGAAADLIAHETKIENPSRDDILKVLLAEECDWTCPYTGKRISVPSLIGEHPQFDIEHIIPFSRCLDDSYLNKTLCEAVENRDVKKNRTPHETYGGTDKWDDILDRVRRFKGNTRNAKFRKFQATTEDVRNMLDSFTSRQLNDTRYASRLARQYLGLLYGSLTDDGIDPDGKRRVHATSGQATAYLRGEWGLNAILGDGPGKTRDDHRHHAVDAVVTAMTSPGAIKNLSDAAGRAIRERRRRFGKVEAPWTGFKDDVRQSIDSLIVSHRLSRRVRGAMHKETFYGNPHTDENGKKQVHIRKPLDSLSKKDVANIVDDAVRDAVLRKLADDTGDPKKVFADTANHPLLYTRNGDTVPIHRVRVKKALSTFRVGEEGRGRNVAPSNNHHMEIIEILDDKGKTVKWDAEVVSLFEAKQRLRRGERVVKTDHGPKTCFLFSLANGDIIDLDGEDGTRGLYRIRSLYEDKRIRRIDINDARKIGDISRKGQLMPPNRLRERNCRKVTIDPIGRIRWAND